MSDSEKGASQSIVRVGTPDDVHAMMNLLIMACHENGFLNPSAERILKASYPALCQDHGIVGCIGPVGGPLEGLVVLRVVSSDYSEDVFLEEKIVYVHPDFRCAKGGRAARLVEFSKKASDTLGIPLTIGVMSNTRTKAKVRLYERMFGPPAGAFFLYGSRTGSYHGAEQ